MSAFLLFNGQLVHADSFSLSVQNRSFRYGDGIFETIRCIEGQPLWLGYHLERLHRSAGILGITLPESLNNPQLHQSISLLLEKNGHIQGTRVRLTFFRSEGGLYTPENNQGHYLIESQELNQHHYALNTKGLYLDVYPDEKKTAGFLSSMKGTSAILYVMASRYARLHGWDDALILNEKGFVAEATSSNIFMVAENRLYTPATDQGGVEGVMKKVLMDIAAKNNLKVTECALTTNDLLKADEIFLSNTIKGIQWVKGIQHKRFYHDMASHLMALLRETTIKLANQ